MLDEDELQALYQWVDEIPLSRPKRNIARDFSDGVLMAELVKHYFPRLVELHNYSGTQSVAQKVYNWETLEKKAFRKLNFPLSRQDMQDVAECTPGAIEKVLSDFHKKLLQIQHKKAHEQMRAQEERFATAPAAAPAVQVPSRAAPAPETYQALGRAEATAVGVNGVAKGGSQPTRPGPPAGPRELTAQILAEKDETIKEMRETIDILEVKIQKLEQLLKIKDQKIAALQSRLPP
eukprot:EG_transcript_16669